MSVQKILVAVDFSENSKEAISFACELARSLGASLTLLHVYQIPFYVFPDGVMVAPPQTATDILGAANRGLQGAKETATRLGMERVETKLLDGAPFVEIIRYAREERVDLIVMGTHGRTGLAHALMGSVAEKVVRKASCPVLTVRSTTHKFELP